MEPHSSHSGQTAELLGIRAEFLLFGITRLGVALLHDRAFEVAAAGLVAIALLELIAARASPWPAPGRIPRWVRPLCMVFLMSALLDNIAGAMIGGTIAMHVHRNDVSLGYVAAIVAAANAGGAGSVLGDTTTTCRGLAHSRRLRRRLP